MQILLKRERSSIVSTWTEMLGAIETAHGCWVIGNCGHEIIGSIYDLVPNENLYDEDGYFKIPQEINGVAVFGLADGEYLESEEFVFDDCPITFTKENISDVIEYCEQYEWNKHPDFNKALDKIKAMVFL